MVGRQRQERACYGSVMKNDTMAATHRRSAVARGHAEPFRQVIANPHENPDG